MIHKTLLHSSKQIDGNVVKLLLNENKNDTMFRHALPTPQSYAEDDGTHVEPRNQSFEASVADAGQ